MEKVWDLGICIYSKFPSDFYATPEFEIEAKLLNEQRRSHAEGTVSKLFWQAKKVLEEMGKNISSNIFCTCFPTFLYLLDAKHVLVIDNDVELKLQRD